MGEALHQRRPCQCRADVQARVRFLACRKATSRVAPKVTQTVMFWFFARMGLNAALSWWKGFQSALSLYLYPTRGERRSGPAAGLCVCVCVSV